VNGERGDGGLVENDDRDARSQPGVLRVANGEAGNVGDQIEVAGHVLALMVAKRKESAGLLVVEIQHSILRQGMSQAVAVKTRKRISLHSGENC
jgi:hypothetical protein